MSGTWSRIKAWRKANPKKYQAQWLRNNKSMANRNADLIREYGIDLNEYNRMFQIQGGCCAIGGIHQSAQKRAMSVDHNHSTGKVRELLCVICNSTLGLLKEDKAILQNMISYLEKHNVGA